LSADVTELQYTDFIFAYYVNCNRELYCRVVRRDIRQLATRNNSIDVILGLCIWCFHYCVGSKDAILTKQDLAVCK